MTTPRTNTLISGLLDEAVAAAAQDVTGAAPATKTSSAKGPTDREKLAAFVERNEDVARLGAALVTIGEVGFQKVAMEESSHGVASDVTGLAAPTTLNAIAEELKDSPTNTVSQPNSDPTTFIAASHSETPPDVIQPKGNADDGVSEEVVNGEGAVGKSGEKGDLADGSANQNLPEKASSEKISSTLRLIAGNKRPSREQIAYAATNLGLSTPEDCMSVLVKSAAHRGQDLVDFVRGSEFNHPTKRQLFRRYAEKTSFAGAGAGFEEAVADAKHVAEAAVKATGILPTATDVANSAKVDQLAATAGLFEVGEFIAAVGGQVGSAATPISQAMAQEAPVPPAAVPPAMTAAAMAPTPAEMGGAPMGAPPMDPAMMGGAPPMDPSMGGAPPMDPAMGGIQPAAPAAPPEQPPAAGPPKTAGAVVATTADKIDAMRRLIDLRTTKASNAPVVTDREELGTGGAPSPKEQAVEPTSKVTEGGPGAGDGSATFEMSASERQVADMLSTNQGTVNAGIEEENKIKREHSDELVNTPLENANDHGLTGSGEPVKGTMEGSPSASTSIGTGGGQSTSTPAVDKASGDYEVLLKLRKAASDALAENQAGEKASSVLMATGGQGTSNIIGTSGSFSGESDTATDGVARARDFAAAHLKRSNELPAVEDVQAATKTSLDDAKKGISLASTAG